MKTRKFQTNDDVIYRSQRWIICSDTKYDDHGHLCYKISRGAWKKFVRADRLRHA